MFRKTMATVDDRLPEMAQGVGVFFDGLARFYPVERLHTPVTDQLGERSLEVSLDPETKVPHARFTDDETPPMQLFTRWYGFSATFPGCEIYPQT